VCIYTHTHTRTHIHTRMSSYQEHTFGNAAQSSADSNHLAFPSTPENSRDKDISVNAANRNHWAARRNLDNTFKRSINSPEYAFTNRGSREFSNIPNTRVSYIGNLIPKREQDNSPSLMNISDASINEDNVDEGDRKGEVGSIPSYKVSQTPVLTQEKTLQEANLHTPLTEYVPSPHPQGRNMGKNMAIQSSQNDREKIRVVRESINRYDSTTIGNINQYAASIDKLELERERSPFIKYAVLVAANMQEQENTYINSSKSNKFITDQKRQIDETNRRLRQMSGAYQRMLLPNREGATHPSMGYDYTEEQLTVLLGMNVDDLSFNRTAELALQMANALTYESTIRVPLRVKTESLIEMGLSQIGRVIRPSTQTTDGRVDERISWLAIEIIKDSTGRSILAHAMAAHMIRERIDIRTTSQSRMKRNDVLIHNETSINALVNYLRSKPFVASFTMNRGSFSSYAPSSYEVSYSSGTDGNDYMDYTDASPDETAKALLELSKLVK
jgi:hypothetical protein